ncbi:MAG: ammonium transporter [Stigonema ocellatum SAG 48.90 = DSM 106950]|nr:ammonium transporter [Stigonema ocellatum SAG 48.90 = DSM 106950]
MNRQASQSSRSVRRSPVAKPVKRFARMLVTMFLIALTVIGVQRAFAGDPGGNKTGTAANVQDAQANPFAPPEPTDKKDPKYADQLKAYQDYKAQADKEPLAAKLADSVGQNQTAINLTWTLIAGFLVMFMQAGFALVETGFCRAKNASHTMLMNFLIYVIGVTGFWIAGFALMYGAQPVASLGGTAGLEASKEVVLNLFGKPFGLFSTNGWFLGGNVYDVGVYTIFLFQMVFMDTAATIPTGAMAERWTLKSFTIYGFYMSMLLYPLFGNWAWGGGWLSQLGSNFGLGHGYVDFAGSGVVHAVGGLCGLAGAIALGPRIGKYNDDGTINPIPGHHIPMGILGTFILAFGWFGFNPGSTLGVSGGGLNRVGIVAVVTMIASVGGALAAALYMIFKVGKPDPTMIANGLLAGLVAITAPSGFVGATSGFIIGAIAGVLVCVFIEIFDKLRIDDPVGAISVHGVCGLWGVLALGLFADGTAFYGGTWNNVNGSVKGIFYGDGGQLVAQIIGCITAIVWAFGLSYVFFKLLDKVVKLRVSTEVELEGLDIAETGVLAYPDFPITDRSSSVPKEFPLDTTSKLER